MFSALESQLGTLSGRRFLDLYAGSGGVGLEARSRGAAHVTLVERNAAAVALIRTNARDLGLTDVSVVASAAGLVAYRPPAGGGYDVVFLDPPYATESSEIATLLGALAQGGWLTADALAVVERPRRGAELTWPEGFEPLRSRRYGESMLWYGRLGLSVTSS